MNLLVPTIIQEEFSICLLPNDTDANVIFYQDKYVFKYFNKQQTFSN